MTDTKPEPVPRVRRKGGPKSKALVHAMVKPRAPRQPKDGTSAAEIRSAKAVATAAGNLHWEAHTSLGRKVLFFSPGNLRKGVQEYFSWAHNNPLIEIRPMTTKLGIKMVSVPKARVLTLIGLCNFLRTSRSTWTTYRKDPRFKDVCEEAEATIYQDKFEGATGGFYNAGIIARDLGLADKTELTGANGGPIQTEDVTRDADIFASRMARLAAAAAADRDGGSQS